MSAPERRAAIRVLLVDDNELDRDMLSRRLARRGFEVRQSTDGADALEQVRLERPDLVVLDTSLPELDGLSATRRLKADPATSSIPVLILSARTMQHDRDAAMAAGCDDFDSKPVELPRLLAKIALLLARRETPIMKTSAHEAVGAETEERELALTPLTLDRLAEIRAFLSQSLNEMGCAASVDAFVLAVDEICANLVQHAGVGVFPGPTRVTVRRTAFDAIITVEDRGRPFDPADAPAPDLTSNWEDRPVGGLGWFLVKQMVDELTYESTPVADGVLNRLTLIKRNVASRGNAVASS